MTQPFFSIITVCRNEECYIDLTAASVANQTYKDYEWLVLDGKSTDKTVKILQKYKKNMAYFTSKKDKGIYYAMNEGIKNAKGQYLIFMNGGDLFYKKDTLKKVHEFITNDDHKHKIYFGTAMQHYKNMRRLYGSHRSPKYKIGSGVKKGYFFDDTLHHQSTFIHKELFDKYGLYDTHYPFAADWEWFIRSIHEKNIFIGLAVSIFDMSGWYDRLGDPVLNAIQLKEDNEIKYKNYSVFFICFEYLRVFMRGSYLYRYRYTFLRKPWQLFKRIVKKIIAIKETYSFLRKPWQLFKRIVKKIIAIKKTYSLKTKKQ